jgi:hypothetical protein
MKAKQTKRNGNGNGSKAKPKRKPGDKTDAITDAVKAAGDASEATISLAGRIDPKTLESLELIPAPPAAEGVVKILERATLEPMQYTRKKGKNAGQVVTIGHRLGFGTGAASALKKLGYTNKQIHELMRQEKDLRNTLSVGATCYLLSKGWVGDGMRVGKASANITFKHPDRMPQGERRAAGPSKAELQKQLDAQRAHAALLEAKLARLSNKAVDVETVNA